MIRIGWLSAWVAAFLVSIFAGVALAVVAVILLLNGLDIMIFPFMAIFMGAVYALVGMTRRFAVSAYWSLAGMLIGMGILAALLFLALLYSEH
jgi:hypothetical protein